MGAASRRVMVVGSINVDLVVTAPRLPAPGETVLGGTLERRFGGKGANQAVAAARAGATVSLIGAVGRDADGDASVAALVAEGVDVAHVRRADAPTGAAIIAVRPDGENQIVVAPGANAELRPDDAVAALDAIASGASKPGVLVASLEVPMPVIEAAVDAAAGNGMRVIVNPAPAMRLPRSILSRRPILVPNEHELEAVGADEMERAAETLATAGVDLVVTLGAAGCLVVSGEERVHIPAAKAERVVDTTGAGDTFVGVLATWLAEDRPLIDAARAAVAAAALSIGSLGARAGMSDRRALDHAIRRSG